MTGKQLSRRLWSVLAAGFVLVAVLSPAAAWADYPNPSFSPVSPTEAGQVTAKPPSSGSNALPVTGGDVAGLVAIGAGLVIVGVVLRRARRRRPSGA